MMQGLHHQQQQLATLLSVALNKDSSSSSSSTSASIAAASSSADVDESNRLAALNSLHRFILYPPNSVVVAHSATFLCQGLFQLLSDNSYPVRRSASTIYGALSSVLCYVKIGSNGLHNHAVLTSLVDRFINWALPLLRNNIATNGSIELALEGIREFLSVGDAGAIERYSFSALKACQELLEDERTSLTLLHQILGVLTVLSLKFFRSFQPHFVDIVDLLLGWAMVPDLGESDRRSIIGSFMQFQKHWVANLQFPLGLLLKFLGDMDVLLQDGNPGTPQQFQRLLALISCFSTVLQSTASGMLEMNLLGQIIEPLNNMISKLLECLSMVGKKFGWSKWNEDLWRCLTLLAEILGEKFANVYPLVADILFQILDMNNTGVLGGWNITSSQIHGVLKTNLQLLSLQKLGLLSSSVRIILQFDGPISQLRLHPNHLVTSSSAATYIFLLQHGNNEVVECAIHCLIEELILLNGMLKKVNTHGDVRKSVVNGKLCSRLELLALFKFDLKVLQCPVIFRQSGSFIDHPDMVRLSLKRSEEVVSFIIAKLNPTNTHIISCMEQQVCIFETLKCLTSAEFLRKFSLKEYTGKKDSLPKNNNDCINENCDKNRFLSVTLEHLKKYSSLIGDGLDLHALAVKLKALDWVHQVAEDFMIVYGNSSDGNFVCEDLGYGKIVSTLVFSVLIAALDGELKVRSLAAVVSELLLQSKLVHPAYLYQIGEFILEKLGDPNPKIRSAFIRLLADILPVAIYLHGQPNEAPFMNNLCKLGCMSNLHWKQIFVLRQLPQHLHSQHLVSVLGFISQRWKMPLSSWIERLIYSCQSGKEPTQAKAEEIELSDANSLWQLAEKDLLGRITSVNQLAGVWWAINEAARYCTSTRLRTNLGGPTQSFAALERMLLDVAHVLQIDAEQSDGSLSIIGSSGAHLLPMRLLLDFVEALKKNVYNAYDGSTVIQCASRQSSLFFRANKKVCEEWFSRICDPMMNAALALQYHDATIHYCCLRLHELSGSLASALGENSLHSFNRLLGDFIRVVRHMALALCKKREPEMLIGLQKWVYSTSSSLFAEGKQISGSNEISGALLWIHGLVYEANGQYEKSATFFAHLLQKEESLSSMGADGVRFAISRIIQSYTATSDWKSLESWLSELQSLRSNHAGKSYSGALTTAGNEMNAIHALAHYDEDNLPAAWASLDLTPKSSFELTLDPKLALQRSEQMLLQAMLYHHEGELEKLLHETQRAKLMLDEVLTVLPLDGMFESAPYAIQLHCIYTLEEVCMLKKNGNMKQSDSTNLMSQALCHSFNKIHQDCDSWLKLFRVYRTISPDSSTTLKLCKNMMTLSRKQGNLGLANRLTSYLEDHIHSCSEVTCRNFLTSSLQYEKILMMHAENKFVDAVMEMWSFLRPYLLSSQAPESGGLDSYLKAKACLKLSTWLSQGCSGINMENIVPKIYKDCYLVDGEDAFCGEDILASGSSTNQMLDEIVGAAVKMSTQLSPAMGKSWMAYASWCFHQANDALSSSHSNILSSVSPFAILGPETLPQKFTLTKDEISQVESIISTLLQEICRSDDSSAQEWHFWKESCEDLDGFNPQNSLLQHVVAVLEAAAGASGADNFVGQSLSASVVSQLQTALLSRLNVEETMISSPVDALVNVWWSLRQSRVSMFGHAAHGFTQFLCHSSSKLSGNPTASDFGTPGQTSVSLTLKAALFILHILLNYGVELKDMLGPALSTVPLFPWQELTPQLFARLSSHSEPIIRKQLEGLLIMLAKLAPRSIVYATLVDVSTSDEEPPEELQHVLDCLMKLYPRLVEDVRLMIHELGNVTVLWEELWLSTLQDLHGDVMRRLNLLKEEAARIANNVTLSHDEKCKISAAKYSAMMAPIFVVLERRLAFTSRKPETPHEKWFQEEYQEQIKSAISAFKSPTVSGAALGDVWRSFDNIAASLAAYQRKSSVSLQEVAPQLACLSSSDVPMPGLEKQATLSESGRGLTTTSQGITTIASFSEQVAILPTKTKPKKLELVGSDGEKYTYLLKGREDLRLDARIMQLLEAVNNILHSSSKTKGHSLAIRYYSVTPISGCAGLIQWVDNVVSIYSVFKSWQQRIHLTKLSASVGGNTKSNAPPVPRPSDMFYGKIIPALKAKGIKRVISRRDWPHEVKQKVLLELMQETPRQLLHQELWCASQDFKAFSSKLKRYSGSLAAMSVVGHILGLGDRHLDNILMDFVSGDIVHIDYNVCFDKGQRLKVPEIVPFRLTQTLEAALGLTGVEGCFRSNCESVLGILRKNKEILLMLLEVFVWDPLLEWTRGDFHDDAALGGEERKGMELAVSLSLFASRVQEIRIPLQEHHDLLLEAIPSVESALKRFLDALNQYEVVSSVFYHMDQERSALLIHETSAKSLVTEANSSSEKVHALYEMQVHEFGQAKALCIEKSQEATTWIEQHGRVIDALRSGSLPEIETCINLSDKQSALTLISAVSTAGVPLTIVPEPTQAQCYDIDRDISQIISELDHGVSCAVTSLQAYSLALQRVLPLNYVTTSPMHGWAQVLQLCKNTISSDTLSYARRQANELIARGHRDVDPVSHSEDLCHKLDSYTLEVRKLEEECAELASSVGGEAEIKAKDRLLSAFMKYMPSAGFARKEDSSSSFECVQVNPGVVMDVKANGELGKKKVLSILYAAVISLYDETKCKVLGLFNDITSAGSANFGPTSDFGGILYDLEEHIDKCKLVEEFVHELKQLIDGEVISYDNDHNVKLPPSRNRASIFKEALLSCKDLVAQMTDAVMPDLMKYVLSFSSEAMDAFGALSQIRGSVETALEQLVQVELERESLEELEKSYFVKVGHITEQQLSLEEAAMKGRDQLSWEEAEELASQEESCRAQLDQLHQTWNQKDMRASSLFRKQAAMRSSLGSSERHFLSLINAQDESMLHFLRSKALLFMLVQPFVNLESLDKILSTYSDQVDFSPKDISNLLNCLNSGHHISDYIWRFKGLLNGHSFFVWKVGVIDSVLDLIMHNVSSSMDQNLGFEQLTSAVKKKLVTHLHGIMASYFKGQIAPALFNWLKRATDNYEQEIGGIKEHDLEKLRMDSAVKKVQIMLEEYCNAHETVRAAKSASSLVSKQIADLKAVIRRTSLEIVQAEWMHDITSGTSHRCKVISQKYFETDDRLYSLLLKLSRPKLLEALQSAISLIVRSIESLQSFERNSATAEGQLERAMNWACGGPTPGMSGNTASKAAGIPPEFRSHLEHRRQLIKEAEEKAKDVMQVCLTVLEFEASRDEFFGSYAEISQYRTDTGRGTWQQNYLSALVRLDISFHSFSRAEQDWIIAQSKVEAASNSLFSASNELRVASVKAKSASAEMQSNLLKMRDCACETSIALSAFSQVVKVHTALTSECGSMLEEVLALTGLHDIHNLGKDAASMHRSLMEYLSKARGILLPLESMLSKDVSTMTDAMAREKETKSEISPIHGQAICQSYSLRIREACQSYKPLVPLLISSVKELYSLLIKLAQTASLQAGNLHKALEGLGECEETRSDEINLSRADLTDEAPRYENVDGTIFSISDGEEHENPLGGNEFFIEERGWISPPGSIYSSSSESGSLTRDANSRSFNCLEVMDQLSVYSRNGEAGENLIHFHEIQEGTAHLQELESSIVEDNHSDFSIEPSEHKRDTGSINGSLLDPPIDMSNGENSDVKLQERDEVSSNRNEVEDDNQKGHFFAKDARVVRGKNAFAVEVLRRIEMKIDGRDIDESRQISISEQVDYLLKQATSMDNLCNMYEGWTPWI